jgi:phospholipase C
MLVVSPFARSNYVDHNLSDQASIVNLVEFNWGLHGINGSADQILAKGDADKGLPFDLAGMFSFHREPNRPLLLDPSTGQPAAGFAHRRR